ncbi:DUF2812 domain-containing protein [Lysinibacillus irui]|uniref:DUF2812 domain-containing protein n=1 Tax=Lysinibacillus irui TaxID=2998077 RepID=A0ABU5NNB2_9BACI|nr:DUF2812 domain-containing protein [Lysinibacillus irui]MEA0552394.1 DUF2812 domain-containing protein [Lysinibacillus irui]MEA0977527.1 DUF2812 domain-containing protein [Lysinibacillus irui]MEA1043681.1 DUF2812 domain-containing protein [Lysinibacillus irui]
MKKRVYRFFIDYEKEERWVNDMADRGWNLKKTMVGYFVFEKGTPGQYFYRNEFVNRKSKDYFEFLNMMNIECVSKFGGWAYYRKLQSEGPFEIFTDATSKINYIKSMNRIFILLLLFNVLAGMYNLSIGSVINSSVGCLNVIVSIMVLISVSKNEKRKKGLKQDLHIFEG